MKSKNSIDLDINVNREGLDDTIEELKEITDNRPNITIRNNDVVNVNITYYNKALDD